MALKGEKNLAPLGFSKIRLIFSAEMVNDETLKPPQLKMHEAGLSLPFCLSVSTPANALRDLEVPCQSSMPQKVHTCTYGVSVASLPGPPPTKTHLKMVGTPYLPGRCRMSSVPTGSVGTTIRPYKSGNRQLSSRDQRSAIASHRIAARLTDQRSPSEPPNCLHESRLELYRMLPAI
jgi:hypothetical protein